MRQNSLSRRKKMVLGGFLAFLLSIIVILLTTRSQMYDEDYYHSRFVKYNIYKTNPDADATAHSVILYLQGEKADLSDIEVFSQEEKNHFSDVRDLVYKATLLLYFFISLALLLFLYLLNKLWKYAFPYFACVAMMTGGCMLFFVALVFLMM